MIGKNISHYKIFEKLGKGGMGVVYKAEDIKLGRTVALKFLSPTLSFDEEAKKRFLNEAQSASALDHPNICTIHEIGETEDGQSFIAMAYYEGETLKDKISKGKLETEVAINIALQICEGLDKAHQNNIVHRDIKPANIFITDDGIVKILDFGIAKVKGQTRLTLMGTTAGTLEYMSPEQARGGEVDLRTDIWSLGIIIYQMVTGELPFKGEYDQALIYSILNREPELDKIPNNVSAVLKKAISKLTQERYQNSQEMISDLKILKSGDRTITHPLLSRLKPLRGVKKTLLTLTTIVTIVLATVLYFYFNTPLDNQVSTPVKKMIVVLPFKNLGSPEDESFVQGMREEISNRLSAFGNLGVISRTSAMSYANINKTSKEIGVELGVDYILEGTVQWAKSKNETNRVRIIPQLIRVSDDINIWSDSYEKLIDDVFNVQNEIAQNVVDKLGVKILPGQFVTGPPPTKNLDAYDYYIKALPFQYNVSYKSDLLTCIRLYEKAIELDSNFTLAHAQISIAYAALYQFYFDRDIENLQKSSEHLQKSIKLNPDLAEVHLANAFHLIWVKKDLQAALNEYKKVIEVQPSNAEASFWVGGIYGSIGQYDLALKYTLEAVSLDPLVARYPWSLGGLYSGLRNYESANKYFKRVIELSPKSSGPYVELAKNYLDWKGDIELARQTINNIRDDEFLEHNDNIFIYMDVIERNFDKALAELKSSKKEYLNNSDGYTPNFLMMALIYNYKGEIETSKSYFDSAKIEIQKMIISNPDDKRLYRPLSLCYAGLGEKGLALNENRKVMEIYPFKNDVRRNYVRANNLVEIYLLVGDYNNAIKQIDYLLSTPSWFSINRLKLDPLFDPLRNLEGYKEIIKKYSIEN